MKIESPVLKRLGPVPMWRSSEKCLESLETMYKKAMDRAQKLLLTARKGILLLGILSVTAQSSALEVVYDGRTPQSHREWAERGFIREHMEVLGAKICKALYGESGRSRLHENFTVILNLSPESGGNPAFAAGRRITWKVGKNPGGDGSGGMGLLCHEMTHVLDMGSDRVFTEAMADWVRNYKVHYHRCTSPSDVLAKRYKALRGGRNYGKYMAGANFVDFLTQNYGEGTIYRVLRGYREHGGGVWEKLFGMTIDDLVEEWRNMQTIFDPVFQWSYNGRASGVVRNDGRFCTLKSISAEDDPGKAGAWLAGATSGNVDGAGDGCISIALHGRFPRAKKVAIAALGSARAGNGKALLLATSSKTNFLAVHVMAAVPGRGCQIVATSSIEVPDLYDAPQSVILAVKDGDVAVVVLDGRPVARLDMKTKCKGCSFTPSFAVGGMRGGIPVAGFSEPQGEGGVLLDDVRVFTRTFRSREAERYAAAFGKDFRPAVAVEAHWRGPQGSAETGNPDHWYCVNSIGERIYALPGKDTAVIVTGRSIPSVPLKAKLECKSFTVDGLAIVDAANVDLRGVRIVDFSDNSRVITRGEYGIAVNAIRGKRLRLDGRLVVTGALKLSGNLEMNGGSFLRLPENPKMAQVRSISLRGEGPVALRPGRVLPNGGFQDVVRVEEMPKDVSRFRLNLSDDARRAEFKPATGGKFLGVSSRRQ